MKSSNLNSSSNSNPLFNSMNIVMGLKENAVCSKKANNSKMLSELNSQKLLLTALVKLLKVFIKQLNIAMDVLSGIKNIWAQNAFVYYSTKKDEVSAILSRCERILEECDWIDESTPNLAESVRFYIAKINLLECEIVTILKGLLGRAVEGDGFAAKALAVLNSRARRMEVRIAMSRFFELYWNLRPMFKASVEYNKIASKFSYVLLKFAEMKNILMRRNRSGVFQYFEWVERMSLLINKTDALFVNPELSYIKLVNLFSKIEEASFELNQTVGEALDFVAEGIRQKNHEATRLGEWIARGGNHKGISEKFDIEVQRCFSRMRRK